MNADDIKTWLKNLKMEGERAVVDGIHFRQMNWADVEYCDWLLDVLARTEKKSQSPAERPAKVAGYKSESKIN